jgi:hypothetical protein
MSTTRAARDVNDGGGSPGTHDVERTLWAAAAPATVSAIRTQASHWRDRPTPRRVAGPTQRSAVAAVASSIALLLVGLLSLPGPVNALGAPVLLGTADKYSVLAGSAVTNTGPSVLSGDVGVHPGTAISGFPPGIASVKHVGGDAESAQAQADLTAAYNSAASRAKTGDVAGDIVGLTLTSGVYKSTSTLALGGKVTLDAEGDPDATFTFQIADSLTTATDSSVELIGGAKACNVFWQIGSSATLGTRTSFKGTIMALTSITLVTGATVEGRALARNGAVTLDTNVFTAASCDRSATTASTTTSGSASTSTTSPTGGTTSTQTGSGVSGLPSTGVGAGGATGTGTPGGAGTPLTPGQGGLPPASGAPELPRTGISQSTLAWLVGSSLALIAIGNALLTAAGTRASRATCALRGARR